MQLNDATRIIDIIDQRIRKATASESRVETTWGTVAAVSPYGRYVDLYLYGQSAPYTSDYFRLPNGLAVDVGDSVKAAIDRERGDRWVEEVHTFDAYNKVEFDIVDGHIRFGSGTAAPDLLLYRAGAALLATDGSFLIDDDLEVAGGNIQIGTDVNLYRAVNSLLKTDDTFHAVGGLRVTSPSNTDGQNFEGVRIVLPNNGYTGLAIYSNPGDTQPSFRWAGWGGMEFGPAGSTAPDTTIARVAAGVIKIDTSGAADQALQIGDDSVLFDADIANRLGIKGQSDATTGGFVFGSGKDTNLYRSAADTLKTDDAMHVASLTVNKDGSNASVITFPAGSGGNDPAYIKHIESPANTGEMRFSASDDDVDTDFFSFGSHTSGTWREHLRITTSGKLIWSGSALELDTVLYRDAANSLRLADGDKFTAPNLFSNGLTVTPVANTPTSATETFPSSKTMTGALIGASTTDTTSIGNAWLGESITSVSSTSITMYGHRTNTTSTTMWYVIVGI
jgi:hypothetical protein